MDLYLTCTYVYHDYMVNLNEEDEKQHMVDVLYIARPSISTIQEVSCQGEIVDDYHELGKHHLVCESNVYLRFL